MGDVKFGANPVEFPPVEAHRAAVQGYEQAGLEFVAYWDQHCLTIPRSRGDYGALVNTGDMGQAVEGTRRLSECYEHLRRMNSQPLRTAVH